MISRFSIIKVLTIVFLLSSCYHEEDYLPSRLSHVLELMVENDYAPSDGESVIKVIAQFPADFNTEDDGKVDFILGNNESEKISEEIVFKVVNNENVKASEIFISHNKADSIKVTAIISINKSQISKSTTVIFGKAYPQSIHVSASSLKISPDSSFTEVNIITLLSRDKGIVSIGTEAETIVVDSTGTKRGIFVDYLNKTDSIGQINNRFTLGNEDYVGPLYIISSTINSNNQEVINKLTIYSQN